MDYLYFALAKPAAILTEIAQGRRAARLVGFPDDVRKHLIDAYAYNEGVLPAATYPNLQGGDLKVTTMDSVILLHEIGAGGGRYRMARSLIRAKGARLDADPRLHGGLRPGGGVEVLRRAAAPGRRARLPRGRRHAGRLTTTAAAPGCGPSAARSGRS